jgi:AcrR family transcriptional regulator
MTRLTRKEKQAHTRRCLMESAAKVFSRRGLAQSSIDEVAETAGYTKGAFYANFANKEELFLAMLDERFAKRIEQIESLANSAAAPLDRARRAGEDFTSFVKSDPEWERLFFEFAAHAARNEDFRVELVTRYRALRKAIAGVLGDHAKEAGMKPPFPSETIALMTFAMANGAALEHLLEPDDIPDDLFSSMLIVFFAGLKALSGIEVEPLRDVPTPA